MNYFEKKKIEDIIVNITGSNQNFSIENSTIFFEEWDSSTTALVFFKMNFLPKENGFLFNTASFVCKKKISVFLKRKSVKKNKK